MRDLMQVLADGFLLEERHIDMTLRGIRKKQLFRF